MTDVHTWIDRVEWEPENDTSPDVKRAIDEIVVENVDMIHVERMNDGCYWMAIYKGKERQIVVFHSKNSKSKIFARTEADSA